MNNEKQELALTWDARQEMMTSVFDAFMSRVENTCNADKKHRNDAELIAEMRKHVEIRFDSPTHGTFRFPFYVFHVFRGYLPGDEPRFPVACEVRDIVAVAGVFRDNTDVEVNLPYGEKENIWVGGRWCDDEWPILISPGYFDFPWEIR